MATFGEKAVGLSFNPSGDDLVHRLKSLYAEIIDVCDEERRKCLGSMDPALASEKSRLYSVAIIEAQTAQMWAVKAATWKD